MVAEAGVGTGGECEKRKGGGGGTGGGVSGGGIFCKDHELQRHKMCFQ